MAYPVFCIKDVQIFFQIGIFLVGNGTLEGRLQSLIGKIVLIMRRLEIVGEIGPRLIIGILGSREIWMISQIGIVGFKYEFLVGLAKAAFMCSSNV